MTTTEMMTQLTDPKTYLELQRKSAAATMESLLALHDESRKLTEDSWKRGAGDLDEWFKPVRQAGEEMRGAGFDLSRRALESTGAEVDRWYGTFLPAE